jgi:hypothetical protein
LFGLLLSFKENAMETLFQLSSLLTMPFWVLMIFLPHWRWTQRIMASLWTVVPAALLYAVLIVPLIPQALPELVNPSLDSVAALLSTPGGATVGWVHFLAFDLFVGRWAYLDSRARGLSAWLVSPALFLILMLGPLGFLLYLGVRLLQRDAATPAA